MKWFRAVLAVSAFASLVASGAARGNTRQVISQENGPPIYTSGGAPFVRPDGSVFALYDGEWAAIPFYRPPEAIPDGFDLINDFDPNVFASEVLIGGHVLFDKDGGLLKTSVRGLGAVPVWFVRWADLEAAVGDDGKLFIEELLALDPVVGTATSFREENHIFGVHPTSHLTVVAEGTLAGGGTFRLHAVEVGLELKRVRIDLDD